MTTVNKNKAEKIVNYTNAKLDVWYKVAKRDYNVKGKGVARFDESTNAIVIEFTENGKRFTHEEMYWMDEAINYTYNVWMENATI